MEQEQSISSKKRKLAKLEELTEKLENSRISSKEIEILQKLINYDSSMTHSMTHHDQNSNMTHRVDPSMTHHSSLPKSSESLPVISSTLPQQSLPVSDQSTNHVTHHVTNELINESHVINQKKKSRDSSENEEKGK